MLLLIDAGNTRVKWALVQAGEAPGAWQLQGSVVHAELDSLRTAWSALPITRVLASNVAGAVMRERLAGLLPAVPVEWFASSAERGGLRNLYRDPTKLGCDRFASAIGAHALHPAAPLIVATCGTATTVDAVSAQGEFLGGMILPGLALMAQSLAQNTAQLPAVAAGLDIAQPFADHTEAAIASGCLSAQAGAIARAMAALPGAQCLLSGGAAAHIAPHLPFTAQQVENLVLRGLHTVAAMEGAC